MITDKSKNYDFKPLPIPNSATPMQQQNLDSDEGGGYPNVYVQPKDVYLLLLYVKIEKYRNYFLDYSSIVSTVRIKYLCEWYLNI